MLYWKKIYYLNSIGFKTDFGIIVIWEGDWLRSLRLRKNMDWALLETKILDWIFWGILLYWLFDKWRASKNFWISIIVDWRADNLELCPSARHNESDSCLNEVPVEP